MSRLLIPLFGLFWLGATLALSPIRWMSRRSLLERLDPYEPGGAGPGRERRALSAATFGEVVGPAARIVGDRVVAAVGIRESIADRLDRLHHHESPTQFRLRQVALAGAALLAGAVLATLASPPPLVVILLVIGLPVLVILMVEQRLISADERRRQDLLLELPVVAEQLGMLLSAGYSLGSALSRLAERGQGVSGADLRLVTARIGHGTPTAAALNDWARTCGVDAVGRLVSVLALNEHAGDLGRLVTGEARTIRRDVHRRQIESIERRSQQVWIPVTVAALVPGAIFIAVPFVEALRAFGAT